MKARQRKFGGFSLIELMVSITIGMLIVAGVTTLIARVSASRSELEKLNRQIENGRFAYEVISNDLRHAGYYGFVPATKVTPAPNAPDVCSTDVATIAASLNFPVQGISNYGSGAPEAVRAAIFSCLPATAILAGTDVLAVRRSATEASSLSTGGVATPALTANLPYVQTGLVPDGSGSGKYTTKIVVNVSATSLLANFPAKMKDVGTGGTGAVPATYGTPAPLRRYIVRIYFISPCSAAKFDCTGEADLPTLKRMELGAGPAFSTTTPEVIAEGIENIQFDYGVNDVGSSQGGANNYFDGSANSFVQCTPSSATAYEASCLWQDVVSASIHILARNIDKTLGYADSRKYDMGLSGQTTAKNDNYKRHVYSGIVRLNNVGMNRECTPTSIDPC